MELGRSLRLLNRLLLSAPQRITKMSHVLAIQAIGKRIELPGKCQIPKRDQSPPVPEEHTYISDRKESFDNVECLCSEPTFRRVTKYPRRSERLPWVRRFFCCSERTHGKGSFSVFSASLLVRVSRGEGRDVLWSFEISCFLEQFARQCIALFLPLARGKVKQNRAMRCLSSDMTSPSVCVRSRARNESYG